MSLQKTLKFFVFGFLFLICVFVFCFEFWMTESVKQDYSKYFSASLAGELEAENDDAEKENIQEITLQIALSYQDQLDEIAEKLDIIQQEINKLAEQRQTVVLQQNEPILEEINPPEELLSDKITETTQTTSAPGGGIIYPVILISEVQALPVEERFVEFYNPNNFEVSLEGWYLQRKTKTADSWGSCITSTKLGSIKIPANGYFFSAKSRQNADLYVDLTLSDDNALALKNPNHEIVDMVGWGNALNFETMPALNFETSQSLGRKIVNNAPIDTDNNFVDFEINTPSPGVVNTIFVDKSSLKVLINEIQVAGQSDEKEEFVELYNPNSCPVDLTGWYLQKKTQSKTVEDSWSSFVAASNFEGKIIGSNDYFLIARTGYFSGSADIFWDIDKGLGDDNALVLKRKNKTESDKVGWGDVLNFETTPAANPLKGQSISRSLDYETKKYKDTDNNFLDFMRQNSTPKY